MVREGARPEIVRDILGHANIDVTHSVYGKSWWEERERELANSWADSRMLARNGMRSLS
jgi:hypothetical protein